MADLLNSPQTPGKPTSPRSAAEVEALVREHLPLVGYIARETSSRLPRHLDSDDLTGAGALALVQAAQAFDPSLGVPFARFANTRIRGAMIDQMRQRDWATRSLRSRARALASTSEALTVALGRTPLDSELAAASGLTESEIGEIRGGQDRASLLSLDSFTPEGEGLAATLRDPAPQPEDALVAAERVGYLRDAIAELPQRLRMVVSGYYLEQRPLTELAAQLNVTQSRVSQLRAEGLELLREALSRLLEADAKAGAGASSKASQGARGRRRDAYVDAVARRSSVNSRVDVGRYLSANSDVDARL
ncbi:sigma-70 family RNA polymerase sigma factor [Kineosporia sp. J2-2]|uniref:Sigma-70 family RNA polymerase sigma factor n=1 Tax=Kineosporia corallincola TaxID=2835133 RepID=A0ABS5TJZ2_9ACTN|nr:sigma-70 family RNA polymerase sigma factor [Kineosporia corallincola]MBT0771424.1 sigma-70 family RNA polymerase sigma factor [Kineosporia corallincola]